MRRSLIAVLLVLGSVVAVDVDHLPPVQRQRLRGRGVHVDERRRRPDGDLRLVLDANLAVTFGGNTVSHKVTVNNGGPSAVVKANTVFGTLACAGNDPAPVNAGQPNTAGTKTGQCSAI